MKTILKNFAALIIGFIVLAFSMVAFIGLMWCGHWLVQLTGGGNWVMYGLYGFFVLFTFIHALSVGRKILGLEPWES